MVGLVVLNQHADERMRSGSLRCAHPARAQHRRMCAIVDCASNTPPVQHVHVRNVFRAARLGAC